ncbi:hypothetical protein SGPA1_21329 [Streptomyces misionensis JCM 4497]
MHRHRDDDRGPLALRGRYPPRRRRAHRPRLPRGDRARLVHAGLPAGPERPRPLLRHLRQVRRGDLAAPRQAARPGRRHRRAQQPVVPGDDGHPGLGRREEARRRGGLGRRPRCPAPQAGRGRQAGQAGRRRAQGGRRRRRRVPRHRALRHRRGPARLRAHRPLDLPGVPGQFTGAGVHPARPRHAARRGGPALRRRQSRPARGLGQLAAELQPADAHGRLSAHPVPEGPCHPARRRAVARSGQAGGSEVPHQGGRRRRAHRARRARRRPRPRGRLAAHRPHHGGPADRRRGALLQQRPDPRRQGRRAPLHHLPPLRRPGRPRHRRPRRLPHRHQPRVPVRGRHLRPGLPGAEGPGPGLPGVRLPARRRPVAGQPHGPGLPPGRGLPRRAPRAAGARRALPAVPRGQREGASGVAPGGRVRGVRAGARTRMR